ncbi:hypothetical protein KSP40_PGU010014 [Platanthera guangdongensis]|uniref:Secreted protein n=1 Tax=Platanthera guangdongensis TaxID=2320717 RepID=A0ABR2N3Z9_9ASPA
MRTRCQGSCLSSTLATVLPVISLCSLLAQFGSRDTGFSHGRRGLQRRADGEADSPGCGGEDLVRGRELIVLFRPSIRFKTLD